MKKERPSGRTPSGFIPDSTPVHVGRTDAVRLFPGQHPGPHVSNTFATLVGHVWKTVGDTLRTVRETFETPVEHLRNTVGKLLKYFESLSKYLKEKILFAASGVIFLCQIEQKKKKNMLRIVIVEKLVVWKLTFLDQDLLHVLI